MLVKGAPEFLIKFMTVISISVISDPSNVHLVNTPRVIVTNHTCMITVIFTHIFLEITCKRNVNISVALVRISHGLFVFFPGYWSPLGLSKLTERVVKWYTGFSCSTWFDAFENQIFVNSVAMLFNVMQLFAIGNAVLELFKLCVV